MKKSFSLLLLLVVLFGCRKEQTLPSLPSPPAQPKNSMLVPVTIYENKTGNLINPSFAGLSYETGILAESPDILNADNKVLVQMVKNLGPGLLRIGGDSSDETFWTGKARNSGSGADSLTTSDIDRLAGFSQAVGWPVLFGLNMGTNDPATATNEAQYVYNKLGNNLYALQAGNEPDVYHLFGLRGTNYTDANYRTEFEYYKSAIQSVVPQVPFAGPGTAYNTDWVSSFADNESKNINLLDAHYYVIGPATNPGITYQTILSSSIKLDGLLSIISAESQKYKLPYRLTECNSVYGGGKAGVSNVFAAALWSLDLMWATASANAQGINFHGGNHLVYSPILVENGTITAGPVYFAMLAFKLAGPGSKLIASTINQNGYSCNAYPVITANNKRAITLINKDSKNVYFTVQSQETTAVITVSRLTAPTITSSDGITLAGSKVADDGTFTANPTERYRVNGKKFAVDVPAGSAAVVVLD